VIGSGIFLVPGVVLRQVGGSFGLAILVWVAGGILSLLGALTYGELSAANPQPGGLYVYIRDCFGRLPAFLYGWALLFILSSGSVATLAVAFSTYTQQFIPLSPLAAKGVSLLMIAVIAAVNVRGTRQSADMQNWTTSIKVFILLAMSIVLLAMGHGFSSAPTPSPSPSTGLISGIGLAMISVLWAYEGWQYCTFSAGETIEPQKNFPRAFLVGTLVLVCIYALANIGYMAALGHAAASSDSIAASAVRVVLGPAAARLITVAVLVSMFSAANGFILTSTRVYYAMAADGVFFRKLAEVHPRYGTPAFAVIAGSVWAMVLAATGTFQQLLTYVVFSGWIFYALGAAAVFVYRRRMPRSARPYEVPGYPWTPLLFIVAAALLVVNTIIAEPRRAAFGLAIVLIGTPFYFIWAGHKHSPTATVQPDSNNSLSPQPPSGAQKVGP
jgi:APA family basic amino acid/polyamine antiporter